MGKPKGWPLSSGGDAGSIEPSTRSDRKPDFSDTGVPPEVDWQSRPISADTDAAIEAVLRGPGMGRPR